MKIWIGATMLAAAISFGGASAGSAGTIAPQSQHKAMPEKAPGATDVSARRRHQAYRHHRGYYPRVYAPRYRSYYLPPAYSLPYGYGSYGGYRPAYYGGYGYRPYGFGGYRPYGGYGYGPRYGGYGYGGPVGVGFGIGFGNRGFGPGFGFGGW